MPSFRRDFPDSPFDIKSLRAGSLLQYTYLFLFEYGPRDLDPEEDLGYLIGNQRQPQLKENLSDIWNLAIHASTLHQCHPRFPIALELSQSQRSLLTLVFWVSPTADCALKILDYLVPPSTALREQYVAEAIRMALYRSQRIFSISILEHFGYLPGPIGITPDESTDKLVNIVLQHIDALNQRIGINAIFSLALSQRHTGLLDQALTLNHGVFPCGLKRFLREIVRRKDAILCNTLSQLKTHIQDSFQLTAVFNDAIALQFHEGMRLILENCHDRKRLDGTIPAVLTSDYETVHLLKVYGCLEPNLDPLLECEVVPEDLIDMSTRTLNGRMLILKSDMLQWYMDVESDSETGQKLGPCHFPLYAAVFLASDVRVISDLISAGGLLMRRKFFKEPRLYPKILQHVSTCMTVERARKVFKGTLEHIRRLFLLRHLTSQALLSRETLIVGQGNESVRSWSAVPALLNFTEDPIGSAKWIERPGAIDVVMEDTHSAQTADCASVDMPKSLQTQESWTIWREQVQNILTRGLEDQVLSLEKEEEPPELRSPQKSSYVILNHFLIQRHIYKIDENWDVIETPRQTSGDSYGLIFDSWRLTHSVNSIS